MTRSRFGPKVSIFLYFHACIVYGEIIPGRGAAVESILNNKRARALCWHIGFMIHDRIA